MKRNTLELLIGILLIFFSCQAQNEVAHKSEPLFNRDMGRSIGVRVDSISEKITFIYQDRKNRYWLGSDQGIFRYQTDGAVDGQKEITLFTHQDGLCSYSILNMQEDEIGNIYFDTNDGVCKYDGEQFMNIEVADVDPSQNAWSSKPTDLWFRTGWGANGPYKYDGETLYALEFPKPDKADEFYERYPNASFNPYGIYSMYKDRSGRTWFGTASLGVCMYDPSAGARGEDPISWLYEQHLTETPSGGDFGIRSIIQDSEGYFWFCNSRYKYEIASDQVPNRLSNQVSYQRSNGVGLAQEDGEVDYPYFMSIAEDNTGDLWMVTFDEGVWRNNGKELIHYPVVENGEQVSLFSIYKDNHGILWLISPPEGLYKYDGETFVKFSL